MIRPGSARNGARPTSGKPRLSGGARLRKRLQSTSKAGERDAFKRMRAHVDAFAATHPDFDKRARAIELFLRLGLNLEEAYQVAGIFYLLAKAIKRGKHAVQKSGAATLGAHASRSQGARRRRQGGRVGRRDQGQETA